ncbi:MAG: PilZ domain-containing protein [Spirochaetia bacterium]|nr:PilZ domain-containing protein [Spirochaetia bacterium]
MATLVKNIEREFLLQAAKRERAVLSMSAGGGEWNTHIMDVGPGSITLEHGAPLSALRKGAILEFRCALRGQTLAFKTTVLEPGARTLKVAMPDKLYKNLLRRFARMAPPGDLSASFSFLGERYDLDFPSGGAYGPSDSFQPSEDFNPADIRELVAEFDRKAGGAASEHGIVMYKNRLPQGPVERLAADTGRAFYLPSILSGLPLSDPFAERTILTRDDFLSWFMDEEGLDREFAEDEVVRLERAKRNDGVLSELLVPVLFQEYVLGHVSVTNKRQGHPPLDLKAVETFGAFARALAWSLKLHGYFKGSPRLDDSYATEVLDVSAGGLLFACRDARLIQALKDGSEVNVRVSAKRRNVDAVGVIRRHYAATREGLFGIEFTGMAPEDFRFLFEYLYGRAFTDGDADSVEGVRVLKP